MWNTFPNSRPESEVLCIWRYPIGNFGGIKSSLEWTKKAVLCRDGLTNKNEIWPPGIHWNGGSRQVLTHDGTIEWKYAPEDSINNSIVFPELELKDCPFCGRKPWIEWMGRYISSPPNLIGTKFQISHCLAETSYSEDLKSLVDSWNKRAYD